MKKDFDFLPEQYRERADRRRSHVWQFGISIMFGAIVSVAFLYQVASRTGTRSQLTTVEPQHNEAVQQALRHAELKASLAGLQHQVSLYTYLQNPWPRTQILSQISRTIPASCIVTSMRVIDEIPRATNNLTKPAKAPEVTNGAELDLKQLLESQKGLQTAVYLVGIADNPVELHEFVTKLSRSPLFAKAELRSFEASGDSSGRSGKFEIRTVVAPTILQRSDAQSGSTSQAAAPKGQGPL